MLSAKHKIGGEDGEDHPIQLVQLVQLVRGITRFLVLNATCSDRLWIRHEIDSLIHIDSICCEGAVSTNWRCDWAVENGTWKASCFPANQTLIVWCRWNVPPNNSYSLEHRTTHASNSCGWTPKRTARSSKVSGDAQTFRADPGRKLRDAIPKYSKHNLDNLKLRNT